MAGGTTKTCFEYSNLMKLHRSVILRVMTGVFATLFCASNVHAQAVSSRGVSGIIRPLRGGDNVNLLEHEARVVLPLRRVVTRSVLRNEGAATTVQIAVPETGQPGEMGTFPRTGYLRDLQVTVDGKRVPLRRIVPEDGETYEDGYEIEYSFWWVADVRFARGQKRVLETRFVSGAYNVAGPPENGSRRLFEYDLLPGRSWKSSIGKLRVVVDATQLKPEQNVAWDIDQPQSKGKVAVWQWRNFKPLHTFAVSWDEGFRNIFVNGQQQNEVCVVLRNSKGENELPVVYAQRRGHSWWVPLRLLASWLPTGKDSPHLGQGAYKAMRGLSWRRRSIDVEIGNRVLNGTVDGQRALVYMSQPAFEVNGVTMVELAPAMRLLGGTARFDAKKMRVDISIH